MAKEKLAGKPAPTQLNINHKQALKLLAMPPEAKVKAMEANALGLDWMSIIMMLLTKGLPALIDWISKNQGRTV